MNHVYKVGTLRNTGEAYRHFRHAGMLQGAHRALVDLMQHRLVAGAVAAMGMAGLVGIVLVFFR